MSQTEEGRIYPKAPEFSSLPQSVLRAHRNGPQLRNIEVRLSTVTPILGGSSQTREIDEVDIIRPTTVRGHLRFWWRALYAGGFPQATKLYERESAIWGTAVGESGGRSMVEIRVDVEAAGQKDDTDINLQRTPGAYALWPARSKNRGEVPPIPRRKPGIRFRYYETLAQNPQGRHECKHYRWSFINYMLHMFKQVFGQFESLPGNFDYDKGQKTILVFSAIKQQNADFRIADNQTTYPDVSLP